ncbi:MAG TPA: HAMP domain-containing histidine kinase [Thermopetrobacter sp.]|nr:HAMP domain-containing histidine kinase [Thermopetrobacter sp.]
MPRPRWTVRLLHTSTFQLAALYLLIFAISAGAVLGYVYWQTLKLLDEQANETIAAEVQGIAEQYALGGTAGVLAIIKSRSRLDTGGLYMLATPVGKRMAGNLKSLPAEVLNNRPGWFEFAFAVETPAGLVEHRARAFYTRLEGGYHLLVGRDIQELRRFGQIIRNTLFWALGLTGILGIGGGLLLSRNFLRRVDAITATVRAIRAGSMSDRVPLEGSGDELDRLAAALNDMLDEIERLMRGMKEVSSNIAHDLRTPLNRLRAQAEDALRSDDPGRHRRALEATIDNADQLLKTFNALLFIARAEAGQATGGFADVDVSEVAREVAELYQPIIEDEGGRFALHAADGALVRGDRQLIAQALVNLLDNALKYGRREGEAPDITIRVAAGEEHIDLEVADRGPGIPAEETEHVKDRFVRLDASRSRPGSGLGLSLVASIARLHDGELILADNAPGLKATLRLPRRR